MEEQRVDIKKGSLSLGNRELLLGMAYDLFKREFSSEITKESNFVSSNNDRCARVHLQRTSMFGKNFEIEVFFRNERLYKIIATAVSSETAVSSNSTGIKLYQEKVMQTARELRATVVDLYGECEGLNYLFSYCEDENCFYSCVDRDRMNCSMVLMENNHE